MEEDPDTTLYFLHYASGDERSFAHVGLANAFYHAYRAAHKKPPKIVALSYGTHWLLSNQPGRRQVVSTRAVLSEAVPFLEERFGAPKRRLLWGMSQGAYNALELALAAPDRWAAVAASCPALYAVDPFGGKAEAVAREERAPLGSVRDGMALFNSRLAGSSVWRAEEPIGRVEAGGRMPPLLLQPNTLDEFGFAAGSEALSRALINRHETVTLSPQRGGHCVFDAAQVAGFFSGR